MLAAGAAGGADGWVMGGGVGAGVEGCAELAAAAGADCGELDALAEAGEGGGGGAGTVKLTVALVEGRASSATRRWCCPDARPWKVSCAEPRRVRVPSSTYLKARGPAALALVTATLTVRFWAVWAPRRGEMIRKSGAGGGGAGVALVVVALATAAPVVFACDSDAV
jgi:hypothetical protein